MLANSASSLSRSKTTLDYIAEGYWQDFLAGRPIAGGIAYEVQLHDCQLDESLASLQRVDTVISQIRRDIVKSDALNEKLVLADERYRNLLLFLAFYAGRVLAQQWQDAPHWYGQFELRNHYPDLALVTDDFYQHMAVAYHDNAEQDSLFFALEPIGLRLFGNIDRQFEAVQGGRVDSGLYKAVNARLPHAATQAIAANSNVLIKPTIIEPEVIKTAITKNKPVPPTPEILTQLLTELNEIEVAQAIGNDDYQQACKILDQFERHIVQQQKPRAQVVFADSHQAPRKQALVLLKKSATAGNTAAMLRLAMYELLGEGLTDDRVASEKIGVDLVEQAASVKDCRAQRLLSKMYYQEIGVPQDMDKGKLWLEQAAENGHKEAASVVAQWQQAQVLITTQQQEQHSIKRYQLLIGAVVVASLLLIIFIQ